jgi:uncharacterized protein YegL
MPQLMHKTATELKKTASHFGYSAKTLDALDGSEYTLAGVTLDLSSSVHSYRDELENAYKEIISTCRAHPLAHQVMVRTTTFSDTVTEMHGFVGLGDIMEDKVDLQPCGMTALYDAGLDTLEAMEAYGKQLAEMDYLVNGVAFIVTDGGDNRSRGSAAQIKKLVEQIRINEHLESVKVILVGVGDQGSVRGYLDRFKDEAGIDQFIWIDDTSAAALSKLANFISRSISAASVNLGTGGESIDLTV